MNQNTTKTPAVCIILAAGKGTRMKSPLPKVLHPVAGEPMIMRSINACKKLGIEDIRVVVGHGADLVKRVVESVGVQTVLQKNQLGTGDAVRSVKLDDVTGNVLILNGDHPLIDSSELAKVYTEFVDRKIELAVVSCVVKKPGNLGRIINHRGEFMAIVEAKDASAETLKINEVNTGIYIANVEVLREILPKLQNQNQAGEYYLTDIMALAKQETYKVEVLKGTAKMAFGVNTQFELARATKYLFIQRAKHWMESGVLMMDYKNVYIEPQASIGPGTVLYPNVHIRGQSQIGSCVVIESQSQIIDSKIDDHAVIKMNCHIEQATIKSNAQLGPFARIRPKSEIGESVHIGNFVETKNVKIGKGSKAAHLTYLGDAELGTDVNVGCGTITCNYAVDRKKYKTIIGDRVFVGSDTQFIAPINIGSDAVIGSGSTITKDVPAGGLAVTRAKQIIRENYVVKKMPNPEQITAQPKVNAQQDSDGNDTDSKYTDSN